MQQNVKIGLLVVGMTLVSLTGKTDEPALESLPHEKKRGHLESVAQFNGPMPTGVTVSKHGRIFVNFPRWGDKVDYTVAELKDGHTVPFPSATFNQADVTSPADTLISVQSVVVDPADRLWILDTGSIKFGPTSYGGPKLVCVNLETNLISKKILFPRDVALPTSYLNDVRFDLRRGKAGMAFISDSSDKGANAIIVVDLDSGKSWRRLENHYSTKAEPNFLPIVEGEAIMNRPPDAPASRIKMGVDGIAISPDGAWLYYCPLASRQLFRVSVEALADPKRTDSEVEATVELLGEKGASDGMESDASGRLYVTSYETNSILRRALDGSFETLVHDPRVLWPDTLAVASNGYLYFTANQLHRQARYHAGKDLRQKPYSLFRVRIDAQPVALK